MKSSEHRKRPKLMAEVIFPHLTRNRRRSTQQYVFCSLEEYKSSSEDNTFCLLRRLSKRYCITQIFHRPQRNFAEVSMQHLDSEKMKGLRIAFGLPDLHLKKHVWNPTCFKVCALKNRNKKLVLLSLAVPVEEIGPLRTGLFTSHPEDWRYANN